MSKWVERVLLRLKHFPHCLHSKTFSVLWIALDLLVKMVMNILGVGGRGGNICKCINWEGERRSYRRRPEGVKRGYNKKGFSKWEKVWFCACVDWGWSRVQRFCCRARKQKVSPHCDFSGCELQDRAASWTFSRTAHTSTPPLPVPPSSWRWWCHHHHHHPPSHHRHHPPLHHHHHLLLDPHRPQYHLSKHWLWVGESSKTKRPQKGKVSRTLWQQPFLSSNFYHHHFYHHNFKNFNSMVCVAVTDGHWDRVM